MAIQIFTLKRLEGLCGKYFFKKYIEYENAKNIKSTPHLKQLIMVDFKAFKRD